MLALARHGYRDEAARIAMSLLEAAELFGGRLPEAFAGFDRAEASYPAEYPTACSPQAWASGAPLMLIRALLGLEPDGAILRSQPHLPERIRRLQLAHIPGRWGASDAGVDLSNQVLRIGVEPTEVADLLAAAIGDLPPELTHPSSIGFDLGEQGSYRLLLEDGRATLDTHAELADCVIRTDEQTLLELFHGTRSFATAMMSDRLRIHGDRLLAITFFTRASEDQPDG